MFESYMHDEHDAAYQQFLDQQYHDYDQDAAYQKFLDDQYQEFMARTSISDKERLSIYKDRRSILNDKFKDILGVIVSWYYSELSTIRKDLSLPISLDFIRNDLYPDLFLLITKQIRNNFKDMGV